MFSDDYLNTSQIKLHHLSQLEPYLFASLVQAEVARAVSCFNFQTFEQDKEYSVRTTIHGMCNECWTNILYVEK